MYMRITMGRIRPGMWAQFETAYRQHVEGAAQGHGLRARWLVRSTADPDTCFTISLWQTLNDMETYERSDAVKRQILHHITPYLEGISTAHHCEIRSREMLSPERIAALFSPVEAVR